MARVVELAPVLLLALTLPACSGGAAADTEADATSATGEAAGEAGTEAGTGDETTSAGTTESETETGGPVCGDGVVEGDEACDDANSDETDACLSDCTVASCGDGFVQVGEEVCDDGNDVVGDGCEDDCSYTPGVAKTTAGFEHTCALWWDGRLKCWGLGDFGVLGRGDTVTIGDDETPAATDFLDLGARVIDVAAGGQFTCAVLEGGDVRCWGNNDYGQLGLGTTEPLGDDEAVTSVDALSLAAPAVEIGAGRWHACARLETGDVQCWGRNDEGQLGLGDVVDRGDDEALAAETAALGGSVQRLTVGFSHNCALMDSGDVRCWGRGDFAELGLMAVDDVGDDELPSDVDPVNVGEVAVVDLSAGYDHTCTLHEDGGVICWGTRFDHLGYGNHEDVGDDEHPIDAGYVSTGVDPVGIAAFGGTTCVWTEAGRLKCWGLKPGNGMGVDAQLGNNEVPSSYGLVPAGVELRALSEGMGSHVCGRTPANAIKCWGYNPNGQLGYANTDDVGSTNTPADVGTVELE